MGPAAGRLCYAPLDGMFTVQRPSRLYPSALTALLGYGEVGGVLPPMVHMQKPPLEPPVADLAPAEPILTGYDEQHLITYLRLLDAESDGADWREVAKVVLMIDPNNQPQRARRAWESHLARAKWMTTNGFEHLLRGGAPH
jgi:hypothetical protein